MAIWVLLHVPVVIVMELLILLHFTKVLSELCCITKSTDILFILPLKVVVMSQRQLTSSLFYLSRLLSYAKKLELG